jgi:hypothetical protein
VVYLVEVCLALLIGVFAVSLASKVRGPAIGLALHRGQTAPCRCFGASSTPLGAAHLIRNVTLLVGSLAGLVGGVVARHPAVQPLGLAVALAVAAVAVLFVVRLDDDVVALFRPVRR